jgi:hypothetical protein
MTVDEYFTGQDRSRQIFEALRQAIEASGPSEMRVSKSQVSFRRSRAFAWVWMPGQYLRRETPPLVLTLGFRSRVPSPRWKQIVGPAPGRFTHHLELNSIAEIDDEVRGWLQAAWTAAGPPPG